ncbi:MAG: DoxX family protein [Chlamydiia bacterium]|nr:DoxX family protein [Chlamydiia bacterium]
MITGEGSWLRSSYKGLVIGENIFASFLLLLIRLYWGWMLIFTGFGKWLHLEATGEFFASLEIPLPYIVAGIVGAIEFIGGISILLGLFARILTIPLIVIFVFAYFLAHGEAVAKVFSNPDLLTKQEPFLFLFVTLIILCFGSGFISFDYWIERKNFGKAL